MTFRKKKILLMQFILLISAALIIFKTYVNIDEKSSDKILSKKTKQEINQKIKNDQESRDIFYNIVYSGLDLSGNRYVIEAKEASNSNNDDGFVNLKKVNAIFYFKDNKNLNITSEYGLYNNKTLDMKFNKDVSAEYDNSTLSAEKAEYFNSRNLIEISKNVIINDYRGSMFADKLIFDLEKNKLNITSSKNQNIKADLNYK